jgi:hypothetical protein
MPHQLQNAFSRLAEALGATMPDHAARLDAISAERLRALYAAPALDWPGLVVTVPSPLVSR